MNKAVKVAKRLDKDIRQVTAHKKTTTAQAAPSTLSGKLLGGLGSVLGDDFSSVGGKVGDFFQKIIGFGDYEVKSNSVINALATGADPPMVHSTSDSVIVRHREYIGDVSMSTTFNTTVYPVQPALYRSFPWLSAMAQNYQQYRWKGLVFEFKSTSSTVVSSTSPAMGSIIMASQYNTNAPIFIDKYQMDNNEYTTTAKPCDSFVHPIECDPGQVSNNLYYTRTAALTAYQDPKFYDMCYLTVATVGGQSQQAGVVCGEIWATYEIELFKPVLRSMYQSDAQMLNNFYAVQSGVDFTQDLCNNINTAKQAAAIFFNGNTSYTTVDAYPLSASYTGVAGTGVLTINLPRGCAGTHIFTIRAKLGSSTTALSGSITAPVCTNCTLNSSLMPSLGSIAAQVSGAGYLYMNVGLLVECEVCINVTNPGAVASLQIPTGGLLTANWVNTGSVIVQMYSVNGMFAFNANGSPSLSSTSRGIFPVNAPLLPIEEKKEDPDGESAQVEIVCKDSCLRESSNFTMMSGPQPTRPLLWTSLPTKKN